MGCKYKKKLEQKWDGHTLSEIKAKTIQQQAEANLSGLINNKDLAFKRKRYGK